MLNYRLIAFALVNGCASPPPPPPPSKVFFLSPQIYGAPPAKTILIRPW